MAGSFNRVTIVGYLGRDPEMRYLPSGDPVTSFTVATTEPGRTQEGQQQQPERTTWFRVSAFGRLAETCSQFLHKGSYVYLEGTLSQREYTDRDGVQRTSLDVRAREMRMLDRRGEGGMPGAEMGSPVATGAPTQAGEDTNMDDIPF
jgi:single-strand DNA-binding protein